MLDEQEGTLDYSRPENTTLLIFRHVKDSWVNKDGVKEVFLGEVISFNPKSTNIWYTLAQEMTNRYRGSIA